MILYPQRTEVKPLVSVVICAYNRAHLIRKTIDSVMNQKIDFPIEIIIGDDASLDNTKDILLEYYNKYPHLFTLLLHETNQGTGSNWAQLMKLVKGDYVAFCDDDDYWHYEEKLKKQVEILETNQNVGLVHTDYRFFFPKKNKFKEIKIKNQESKDLFMALFDGEYKIMPSTVVFRNYLAQMYLNLDDYIKYSFPIQDWVTWIQIAGFTEFYHINISTLTYCISSDSVTRSYDFSKLYQKYEREKFMYQYICKKFSNLITYDEQRWVKYIDNIFLVLSYHARDYEKAKFYGKKVNGINARVIFSKNKLLFRFYLAMKDLLSR